MNDTIAAARNLIAACSLDIRQALAAEIATLEAALAAPSPRLIINVTGGMVQGASIDRETAIDVLIIDFDNDDIDEDDVHMLPSEDGDDDQPGSATELTSIDLNPDWVGKVYAVLDAAE